MLVTQSCLTLWDPMDYSPPGSSVHGIFQARILEWVAVSFSRGSSPPRDQIHISCIAERLLSESEGNFICPRIQGKILEFVLPSLVIILELVSEPPAEFLNMQISRALDLSPGRQGAGRLPGLAQNPVPVVQVSS